MIAISKPLIDLSGQRFGRLLVKAWAEGRDKKWICVCDCGRQVDVRGAALRIGKTKSCGCLKAEKMAAGLGARHKMCETPTYSSWDSMIGRCMRPNDPTFGRYGGAGITVCQRWTVFDNFFADMGERPAGTSLDRIDPNGDYEPQNCRWASAKTQANNRRNNRKIAYDGQQVTIRQLSDLTGTDYQLLRERILKRGWDVKRAVTTERRKAK